MTTPSVPGSADAIVVLGAGLQDDGTLEPQSLRRAVHGIVLHQRGLARFLAFCGSSYRGRREAEVRASLAGEMGITPDAILTETTALTTREEAARITALVQPRGVRRILLVTDSLHMSRAKRLFERSGFEVLPSPTNDFSIETMSPEGRLVLMRRVLGESVARLYYHLAGYY